MLSHRSDPLVSEQLRKAPKKRPIVQQPEVQGPKVEQQPQQETIDNEISQEPLVIEIDPNQKIENKDTIEEDEEEVLIEIHKVKN